MDKMLPSREQQRGAPLLKTQIKLGFSVNIKMNKQNWDFMLASVKKWSNGL